MGARAGFWVAYAGLGLILAGVVASLVGLSAFQQPVRTVTRVKAAPPIRSVAAARDAVKGDAIGADAGLPEGCSGVYVQGGAVIFCNQ